MILEVEKLCYVALQNEAVKTIELFEPNAASRVIGITERGPQGAKGDKGDKGEDVSIFSKGNFVALASKINFSQAISAVLNGNQIDVSGYVFTTQIFQLTDEQLESGQVILPKYPELPSLVRLLPEGGVEQFNGLDFAVAGNVLTWKNLGLDGFFEKNDRILVSF
jgi:hypothetical protein